MWEEALKNIADAIQGCLAALKKHGHKIPESEVVRVEEFMQLLLGKAGFDILSRRKRKSTAKPKQALKDTGDCFAQLAMTRERLAMIRE